MESLAKQYHAWVMQEGPEPESVAGIDVYENDSGDLRLDFSDNSQLYLLSGDTVIIIDGSVRGRLEKALLETEAKSWN